VNTSRRNQFILCSVLGSLLLIQVTIFAQKLLEREPDLEYSQFVKQVKQDKVDKVRLSANPRFLPASILGTRATFKLKNGKEKATNIPPGDNLIIKILVDNVSDDIQIPSKNGGLVWYDELSRLFFPFLLVGTCAVIISKYTLKRNMFLVINLSVMTCWLLYFIFMIVIAFLFPFPRWVKNPISYTQFFKELQDGEVINIGLSLDRSRAVVDTKDGYQGIVHLPPDDRLNNLLGQNVKGKIYTIPDDRFNSIVTEDNAKVGF
jgi:ATP-dependent Zn protease